MGDAMKLQYQQLPSWNAVRMGCSFTESPFPISLGSFSLPFQSLFRFPFCFHFPSRAGENLGMVLSERYIHIHVHTHIYSFFWKLKETFRHGLSLLCSWKDITHPVLPHSVSCSIHGVKKALGKWSCSWVPSSANSLDCKDLCAADMHMASLYIPITHANELWLFPCTIIPAAPASPAFA